MREPDILLDQGSVRGDECRVGILGASLHYIVFAELRETTVRIGTADGMDVELRDKGKQEVERSCDAAMERTNGSACTYIPSLHSIERALPINNRSTDSFISVPARRVSSVILRQCQVKILQDRP